MTERYALMAAWVLSAASLFLVLRLHLLPALLTGLLVHELVHGQIQEARVREVHDWPQARHGRAGGYPDDRLLGDRGIADPLRPELFEEVALVGSRLAAARRAVDIRLDVLADDHDALIRLHGLALSGADGPQVRHDAHCATSGSV